MTLYDELSEKERELATRLGFSDLFPAQSITAPGLYRILIEHCFLNDIQGSLAESVRRCGHALNSGVNGKLYRCTPDFDALIQLD